MRILVGADVPPDPNSGAAGTVFHTNRALRELGHEVDEIWADDLGRRIRHGNLHYLLELPRTYRNEVGRRCAEKQYDVIQLSQPHAWLAAKEHQRRHRSGIFVNRSHGVENMVNEVLDQRRKQLGLPLENGWRHWPSLLLRKLLERHFFLAAKYCDGFVVGARDNKEYLRGRLHVDTERIAVAPHGLPRLFIEKAALPFHEKRLKKTLYVCQLSFFKGTVIFVDVMSRVLARCPEMSLTWVCSAVHHDQVRSFFPPTLRNRIALVDTVPQEQLIDIYDEHGVFVFPSFFEGFGKAPLEAMARGLCVISSRVGGMKDYIRDGVNGFLCDSGDIEAMTVRILDLAEDMTMAKRISRQARNDSVSYTWLNCAQKAVEFYQELLDCKEKDGRKSMDR